MKPFGTTSLEVCNPIEFSLWQTQPKRRRLEDLESKVYPIEIVFVSVDIFGWEEETHGSCPVAPYGVMGLVDPVGGPGGRLPGTPCGAW